MFFPDITVRLKNAKKEQASITCSSIVVIIIVILYVISLHSAKTIFSRVRVGTIASKYLRILLLLTVSQVILDSGYHPRNQLIKFELLTQSIMQPVAAKKYLHGSLYEYLLSIRVHSTMGVLNLQ